MSFLAFAIAALVLARTSGAAMPSAVARSALAGRPGGLAPFLLRRVSGITAVAQGAFLALARRGC